MTFFFQEHPSLCQEPTSCGRCDQLVSIPVHPHQEIDCAISSGAWFVRKEMHPTYPCRNAHERTWKVGDEEVHHRGQVDARVRRDGTQTLLFV